MAELVEVCIPCSQGDHSSHDGTLSDGTMPGGDPEDYLDLFDCKTANNEGTTQCMCRATWPHAP